MRGRVGGEFTCNIRNTFYSLFRTNTTIITGINDHVCCMLSTSPLRYSGRGTEQTYRCHLFLQQYTCQYPVSWESPADTVTTGYVIYYHPKTGGPVISESVTGRHRESHSLTGLQRGHTYNISIVALSQHL